LFGADRLMAPLVLRFIYCGRPTPYKGNFSLKVSGNYTCLYLVLKKKKDMKTWEPGS